MFFVAVVQGTQLVDVVFNTDGKGQNAFVGEDKFSYKKARNKFTQFRCNSTILGNQCPAFINVPNESKSGRVKGFAKELVHMHSKYSNDSYNEDGLLKELVQMAEDIENLKQT